jgi:hypothetical protein
LDKQRWKIKHRIEHTIFGVRTETSNKMAPAPSKLAHFKSPGGCHHETNIYPDHHEAVAEDLPDDEKCDEEMQMPDLQNHHLQHHDDDEEDDDEDDEEDDDEDRDGDMLSALSALSNVSIPKSPVKRAKQDGNYIANLRESMESLSIGHAKPYVPSIPLPSALFAEPPRAPTQPGTPVPTPASPEPSAPFLQAVPPALLPRNPDPRVPTVPLPRAGSIAAARIRTICNDLERAREEERKEKLRVEYNKKRARIRKVKRRIKDTAAKKRSHRPTKASKYTASKTYTDKLFGLRKPIPKNREVRMLLKAQGRTLK